MANQVLPDPSTTFGKRVRERLAEEIVVWLTTVGADGTPQPNPTLIRAVRRRMEECRPEVRGIRRRMAAHPLGATAPARPSRPA